MRATKAYIAGLGTTGILITCFLLLLAVGSALVAFQGWPGAAAGDGLERVVVKNQAERSAAASASRDEPAALRGEPAPEPGVEGAGQRSVAGVRHGSARRARQSRVDEPAPAPAPGDGSSRAPGEAGPGAGDARSGGGDAAKGTQVPAAAPDIGDSVERATGGLGDTAQGTTGALGDGVRGATGGLGDPVGGVSPGLGETVTGTGDAAGQVVDGAGEEVGNVVQDTGSAVNGVLP
jgi:hypothetical protein